jgi:hypothetical protein
VFPDRLRPLTPCHRSAFTAMEEWIGQDREPAAGHTVAMPGAGRDPLTECSLGRR